MNNSSWSCLMKNVRLHGFAEGLLAGSLILLCSLAAPLTVPAIQAAPGPAPDGATLYLAQAQFAREVGPDGKQHSVPGPARLEIFRSQGGQWTEDVLEDPESNVFHKALWFQPVQGEPGILTIGATKACLKIWRKQAGKWEAQTLWNPTFGGKFDRLRDCEVADVTGDGLPDIIIATHDQGVVAVVSWKDGRYQAEELCRQPDTIVHEIEVGDVDGDGIVELFATPSTRNKLDGTLQPGTIEMWKYRNGSWVQRRVDAFETRHAKEILCATLTGEQRPVLFASLEAEGAGGDQTSDTTKIRMYRFTGERIISSDLVSLPGQLCRFLTCGDTDGDGLKEIIASTKSSGIFKLLPPAAVAKKKGEFAPWRQELIVTGTSGFEHATYLYDFDGDGRDEIYVAADEQGELRRYVFDGQSYVSELIGKLKERAITWNVTAALGVTR